MICSPTSITRPTTGVADGVENVQHKTREVIKYGADLIKICATGGVLSKGDDPNAAQFTEEEMKAIVADAHRLGRKVAAHAHGAQGVIWASNAGVDSVEHGHLMNDEAIATLKKNGTYLVPTLYLVDWQRGAWQPAGLLEAQDGDGFAELQSDSEESLRRGREDRFRHRRSRLSARPQRA